MALKTMWGALTINLPGPSVWLKDPGNGVLVLHHDERMSGPVPVVGGRSLWINGSVLPGGALVYQVDDVPLDARDVVLLANQTAWRGFRADYSSLGAGRISRTSCTADPLD